MVIADFTPPPVASLAGLWNRVEQRAVESHLGAAVIGSPAAVARKLREIPRRTRADELRLFSDCYRLDDRLHSCEIVAGLLLNPINRQK